MNILRRITGFTVDPLEARLDRLVGRRLLPPAWQALGARVVHHAGVEEFRDANGIIRHLRIGPWRIIAASKSRRIAEVRDLACERVAVRIEREDPAHRVPHSTTWELYNLEGHLLAMLQSLPEQGVWLGTNFETGHVAKVKPSSTSRL